MSIENIKNQLVDIINKKDLVKSLEASTKELEDVVLKTAGESSHFFNRKEIKNQLLKTKIEQFFRINSNIKADGIFDAIVKRKTDILENLNFLRRMVEKEFEDKIAKDNLDYRQVNVLKIIDLLEFFNRYTLAFLTYSYVLETATELKHDKYIQDSITKSQEKFINDNWLNYCNVCGIILCLNSDFNKKLESIKKIEVLDDNETVLRETMGINAVNPFTNGFIPTKWNPIIWVRRIIADWQVSRYKALEDNVRLLEVRRLHLEKLRRGEQDPVLEKTIKEVEDLLAIQQYKLDKLTKAYGLDEE